MVNNVEASKILKIMSWADGTCPNCARYLFKEFVNEFGFKDLAIKYFKDEFDRDLYEESTSKQENTKEDKHES